MNDDGSSSRRRPPSYHRSSVLRIDPNHSNQNDIVLEHDTIGMNDSDDDEDAGGERAPVTTSDYMNRDAADDDDDDDDGREEEHPPSQLQPQQPQSPPVSFYFYHSPTKNSNTNTTSTSGSAPSKDHPPPHPMGETTQSSSLPRMMSQHPHHPQRPLLLPPPPPALPYTTKSQHHHHKTTTLLDDCESGISMNCRCRKATMIMMTFLVAIVIAFYSNISLVIKLGAAVHKDSHYNNDHPNNIIHHPYDAYHKFQQMILSSPTTTTSDTAITTSSSSSKNKKSRIDTAMIGDDDDPLEGSDDDGSNGEEEDDGTSTTTAVDAITTDDGTALDSFTSVTDIQATSSSSSSLHQKNKRLSPSSPKPMNRKYNKYSKQKQRANNTNKKKKNNNNNNNNNNNKRLHPHQTEPKRNNAKANIQDIVPTPESMSVNASFSACLLIKDDNEILSEWIAYHYHTIKLRQLIVAVDPLSSESPTILLAKWKLLTDLNIRLWHDEHYMPDDFMETGQAPPNFIATETDLKHSKMRAESILEISNHRYRQRVFLSSCLRSMRAEGNSWVIHIVRILLLFFGRRRRGRGEFRI